MQSARQVLGFGLIEQTAAIPGPVRKRVRLMQGNQCKPAQSSYACDHFLPRRAHCQSQTRPAGLPHGTDRSRGHHHARVAMKTVSAVRLKTESTTHCAYDAWNEDTIPRSHTPPRLFPMTNETIPGESQPRRMDLAAEGRLHAHPPTPAETRAEESPASRAPVD